MAPGPACQPGLIQCAQLNYNRLAGQFWLKSRPEMTWNPDVYLTFADQRTRPAADLLARVPAQNPQNVIDLGCGPGNSTALLRARWPAARLEGLDSSAEMLAEARKSGVAAEWI